MWKISDQNMIIPWLLIGSLRSLTHRYHKEYKCTELFFFNSQTSVVFRTSALYKEYRKDNCYSFLFTVSCCNKHRPKLEHLFSAREKYFELFIYQHPSILILLEEFACYSTLQPSFHSSPLPSSNIRSTSGVLTYRFSTSSQPQILSTHVSSSVNQKYQPASQFLFLFLRALLPSFYSNQGTYIQVAPLPFSPLNPKMKMIFSLEYH